MITVREAMRLYNEEGTTHTMKNGKIVKDKQLTPKEKWEKLIKYFVSSGAVSKIK